jgi:predicted TIM-barrel fold metal-dependent hydrolase
MAGARAGREEELKEVVRSAEVPNIYIKLSGFHYVSGMSWDYPQTDAHPVVRALYDNFGSERLCWGSDYPVVRFFTTYQQALEAFRTHCSFVSDADKEQILGGNLERLLAEAG